MKSTGGKDAAATTPRAPDSAPPPPSEETSKVKALEEERDRLKAELADARDRFLRARADYDNLVRRVQKESADSARAAKGALLLRFAAVCESIERGVNQIEKTSPEAAKGVRLVADEARKLLKDEGVKEIDTTTPFNYRYHEAVESVESADRPEGAIVDVVQRGYLLGGDVLRPALVRVAKAPRKPARPESAAPS